MNFDLATLGPLAASLARAGLPTLGAILSDAVPFPANLFVRPAFAAISAALGVDPDAPTAAAQVQAQVDADPAGSAAKLEGVEQAHKDALDAANEELRIRTADVQDARATEAKYVAAGSPVQYAALVVSALVIVGFYATIAMLFFHTADLNPNQTILLNTLFGAEIPAFAGVIWFWTGSSSGSKDKDHALIGMARSPAPTVQAQPGSHVNAATIKGGR